MSSYRYLSPMYGHLKAGKLLNIPVSVVFLEDMGSKPFHEQNFDNVYEALEANETLLNEEIKLAVRFIRLETGYIKKKQQKLALMLARKANEDREQTAKTISLIKSRNYFR